LPDYSWREVAKIKGPELQACPIWLLTGEEVWLRQDFLAKLLANLLPPEERSWGLEIIRLSPVLLRTRPPEGTWAKHILRAVATLPFFSPLRVVVVEEIQLLPPEQQEELAEALADIPPTTKLIFIASDAGKATKSKSGGGPRRSKQISDKLRRQVEATGKVVSFIPLGIPESIAWAQEQARKQGKRLEPSAAAILVQQRLGPDLGKLKSEIDKLILFVGENPTIRAAEVEAMTPRILEERVFDLTDALTQRAGQQARALGVLRGLLKAGEEPVRILALLIRHLRLIWQVKGLLERGWRPGQNKTPEADFEAVLLQGKDSGSVLFGRLAWQSGKLAEQARRFTWFQLEQAFLSLFQCDLALKGMSFPPRNDPGLALELAVIALSSGERELPIYRRATPGAR
jgi:DNA polymerase III subunit delta